MSNRLLSRVAGRQAEGQAASPVEMLTNRELQVFEMLGQGSSVREIARRLHLSPKTVERYRENLKHKLGLNSASELLRHATQWILENP
jgi:DNA-binding NarL/FixJ family response regulator